MEAFRVQQNSFWCSRVSFWHSSWSAAHFTYNCHFDKSKERPLCFFFLACPRYHLIALSGTRPDLHTWRNSATVSCQITNWLQKNATWANKCVCVLCVLFEKIFNIIADEGWKYILSTLFDLCNVPLLGCYFLIYSSQENACLFLNLKIQASGSWSLYWWLYMGLVVRMQWNGFPSDRNWLIHCQNEDLIKFNIIHDTWK